MYSIFENLPKSARIWIYQSSREILPSELKQISIASEEFCNSWQVHGNPLKSSYKVLNNWFLILAADESEHSVSGCSIDSSVLFIKNISQEFGIDFLDRTQVAYLSVDNESIKLEPISAIKEKVQEGVIVPNTVTFNNLVKNIEELDEKWIVPASESWMKKYF